MKSASGNRASLSLLGHDAAFAAKAPLDGIKGDVVLGVRPEFLPIQPDGPLRGKTYSTLPAGMETTVKLTCGGAMLTSVVFGCVDYAVDTELPLSIVGDNIALFDKASGKSIGVPEACNYLSEVGLCAKDYIDREVDASTAQAVVFYTNIYEEAASWDYPSQKKSLESRGIPTPALPRWPGLPTATRD